MTQRTIQLHKYSLSFRVIERQNTITTSNTTTTTNNNNNDK